MIRFIFLLLTISLMSLSTVYAQATAPIPQAASDSLSASTTVSPASNDDTSLPATFNDCMISCNTPCATVSIPGGGTGTPQKSKAAQVQNTPNKQNDENCKACMNKCQLYCPTDPNTGQGVCHWKTLIKANS